MLCRPARSRPWWMELGRRQPARLACSPWSVPGLWRLSSRPRLCVRWPKPPRSVVKQYLVARASCALSWQRRLGMPKCLATSAVVGHAWCYMAWQLREM
eukprot:1646709-Pyramimonas_sp.AAC.1